MGDRRQELVWPEQSTTGQTSTSLTTHSVLSMQLLLSTSIKSKMSLGEDYYRLLLFSRCIRGLLKNCVVLLVTHQVQFAVKSDRILVLNEVHLLSVISVFWLKHVVNGGMRNMIKIKHADEAKIWTLAITIIT